MTLGVAGALLALGLSSSIAHAQLFETKIWNIALGTHVRDLPADEFVLQACGTNGGPPSRVLNGFEEFNLCQKEQETGLHEVWFSYDDEAELIARAYRAPPEQMGQMRSIWTSGGRRFITKARAADCT